MTDKLEIAYRIVHKALPPQPIRMKMPGWGGSPAIKMEDASEPQPWHCPPFVAGSAYGIELLYHYETECHVVNDNGNVRIEWDYAKEPGGILGFDEFGLFAPTPSKFYTFSTLMDLQAPPGYVLRTNPHPRFFTDDTGTVPLAVVGHVQTEWWSSRLFVVFKVPPPGCRHIFRRNEPYVQILFVPQKITYELTRMPAEQEQRRRELDEGINAGKPYIARNVWHNPSGAEFSDHYNVLARAFAREGTAGVEQAVQKAVDYRHETLPSGKTLAEYFELAGRFEREGKFVEAKSIYLQIRRWEPKNAEGAARLGLLAASMGLLTGALLQMSQAVALAPRSPVYRSNMGEILRRLGRHQEAEASLREALKLNPSDPQCLSNLGLILALQRKYDQARESFNAALALDPNFAPARNGLNELSSDPPPTQQRP